MAMKMLYLSGGSATEKLPDGCKEVKFLNGSTVPVFVTFGDASVTGSDQGNRVEGELELDVPKGATHMALKATQPTSIFYDAGHARAAKHHDEDDDPPHHKAPAKKK